ncbi:MAG: MarR family transcriptional regulator, partial [Mycobacteriaceae bacterium]
MTEDVQSWPTGRLLSTAARLLEHSWEALLREHDLT